MQQTIRYYFDNAATTPIHPEVVDAMMPFFLNQYGNPSSIHSHGREVRSAIEKARKTIAKYLNCSTSEIFFTSGGTEADNMAIFNAASQLGIEQLISCKTEHHAVLHTLEHTAHHLNIPLYFLSLDAKGNPDLEQLETLLATGKKSLVSLMHGNNELGNIIDLGQISTLCQKYHALLHSDTVQTMAHYPIDLQAFKIDFLAASAHKFHGPKGVGFIYINGQNKISPYIHGGSQERNMRGGTENVSGIIGMAKAFELAHQTMPADHAYVLSLKKQLREGLLAKIPTVTFNGESGDMDKSLYTVLNVSFPPSDKAEMLLFNLDINKISASGGSACTSGSDLGSHVLTAIGASADRPSVRFSFSKFNTPAEVDYVIEKVAELVN